MLICDLSSCCLVKIRKLGIHAKTLLRNEGLLLKAWPGSKAKASPCRLEAPDPVRVGQGRLYKEAQYSGKHRSALLGGEGLLLKAWPGSKAKASPRHLKRVPELICVGEDLWNSYPPEW